MNKLRVILEYLLQLLYCIGEVKLRQGGVDVDAMKKTQKADE